MLFAVAARRQIRRSDTTTVVEASGGNRHRSQAINGARLERRRNQH